METLWPEFERIPFDSSIDGSMDSRSTGTPPPRQDGRTARAGAFLDSDAETESNTSNSEDDLLERAEDLARALVTTSLGGRCPSMNACNVLEDLLIDAVFTGAETLEVVRERTAALAFNNGLNTVLVDSGRTSVEDSRCLPGLVLSRQVHLSTLPASPASPASPAHTAFSERQRGPDSAEPTQSNAVFLQCDFANIMPTSAQSTTILGGHIGAASVARYRETWIQKVLAWFRDSGIGLLVCSVVLDETTRRECNRVGIAVCHAVPLPELRRSCAVLDTFPLTEVTLADLLQPALPPRSITALAFYRRLNVGGRTCTWLVPAAPHDERPAGTVRYSSTMLARTLTVGAVDSALGEELACSLRDAIKLLATWLRAGAPHSMLKESLTTAHLVPGGGVFEIALSCMLGSSAKHRATSSGDEPGILADPEGGDALKVVSHALLRIPAQLYWIAHPRDVRGWSFDALPKLM